MRLRFPLVALPLLLAAIPASASNNTVTVTGKTNVYSPSGDTTDGTSAIQIAIPNGTSYITFSTTGTVSVNSGINNTTADGSPAQVASSYAYGYGSQSGIQAPGAGYLTGVFVNGTESGGAPATLDYTTTSSVSSSSYSPLLDQTFFIGDGLTGNGTGVTQLFYVPTGATYLYLGISDAGGYVGNPGGFSDNTGSYSVTYNFVSGSAATPEPSSFALLGTGLTGLAAIRRRFKRA